MFLDLRETAVSSHQVLRHRVGTLTAGLPMVPASLPTIPDWADAISRPSPARIFLWTYMILYLVGLLILFPRAVAGAHKLRPAASALIGITGALV